MAQQENSVMDKIEELEAELRHIGIWQKITPASVPEPDGHDSTDRTDFIQWLRFVFIPNHLKKNKMIPDAEQKLLVPQAVKYFGDDLQKGKLLQILIELDSLV